MAATADLVMKQMEGQEASFPVAAATTLYRGSMMSKVAGYAQALTDGTRFDGHVISKVANTSAAGYGTAGQLDVRVLRGKYKLQVTLTGVSELMVGAVVYAIDDNSYTLCPMRTPVGKVFMYVSSNTAIVEFNTEIHRGVLNGGYCGIFEGFFNNITDGNVETNNSGVARPWTRTSVNGAGIIRAVQRSANPASPYCLGLQIIPDTAENDSESLQLSGEMFYLGSASKPVFFGTRITVPDADEVDTILGLVITDTTLLAGSTDGITLRVADGSGAVKLYVEKDSTETASASAITTLTDGVAYNIGFIYNGTYVIPYVDGVAGTALAVTNLPNNEGLTLSIEHTAGAASDGGLTLDFVDAYQLL